MAYDNFEFMIKMLVYLNDLVPTVGILGLVEESEYSTKPKPLTLTLNPQIKDTHIP